MEIAVVNLSTRFSDADAAIACRALNAQIRDDVAPAWGRLPWPVKFYRAGAKPPTATACLLLSIFDNADQAGALGWHTVAPDGRPYGKVFVGPVLDNGGGALDGELSVSSVLSHEGIEGFLDINVNMWAEGPNRTLYAVEGCDPVESDSYTKAVQLGRRRANVALSNFVLPDYFREGATAKLDFLGKLSAAFTMSRGGYVVFEQGGTEQQKFGDKYPAWKLATKDHPAARTFRRRESLSRVGGTLGG